MESVIDGISGSRPPHSPQDENFSQSSQLSNQSSSPKNDPALLTQLHPTVHDDNYCNTQMAYYMPSESQCSRQPMLATQPTNNDPVLQSQFSRYNDYDDDDAAKSQSSQQQLLLFDTQPPTHTQYGNDDDDDSDDDDTSMYDKSSQPNTQENRPQFGHLSMTQQQSLLLTQQQECESNKTSPVDVEEQQHGQQSSKQRLDSNDGDNDNILMSQEQRINEEEVEFLYNTQQNREEDDDDDDESDYDDDDMERLVEEQNLAVSLSMEVIEECEESQRSRDNDAKQQQQSVHDDNNTDTYIHDDDYDDQLFMMDATFNASSSGFGFVSVGSGRAITVSEEELAKADKMFAEKDDKNNNTYDDKNEQQHSIRTAVANSAVFGFASAGSRKAVTVNEKEMAKAPKMLADDTEKSNEYHDGKCLSEGVINSLGCGFTSGGSGKANTVNEVETAQADKMFAEDDDDTQAEKRLSDASAEIGNHKKDNQYDYGDQADHLPSIAAPFSPSSSFGFKSAGSGKAIAVNEEEMARAAKMLDDDDESDCDTASTIIATSAATSKMIPTYQQSQQAKQTTVTNPYARKRSIDQISNDGVGKPTATSTAATQAAFAAPTPSRKLVFNPYAKTVQSKTKAVVRNPYAKVLTAASASSGPSVAIPPPSRQVQFSRKESNNAMIQNVANDSSVIQPRPKEETQFHRKGISFSLPVADRLPSRNVSYKPAEILTVDELYKYLFGANTTTAHDFKELQSVRITGTLLCVSTSFSDEKDGSNGDLYSTGTFLLIGDPLEKSRFPAQALLPKQQPSNTNSSIPRTVTKPRPMSILRNKNTSIVRTTQPALTSDADGKAITTPAGANESTQTVTSTTIKKPILRGGLLNNNKPKKFVYAGNKSRSSLGGGLHRKFVTPKRGATLATPNTTGRISSAVMRKQPISLVKSVSVSSGRSNVKIETVIQRHPAPLVPVWIGSSLDDDGLDGSVVNDLVMVMGEIVVEHCLRCLERNENGSGNSDEERTDDRAKSIEDDEVDEDAKQDDMSGSGEDKQQAIAVKSVRDASLSIAAAASSSTEDHVRKRSFCRQCVCFLSARIVKNANGTDMHLQKEALRVRREYFNKRKKQVECLRQGMVTSSTIYSVGCGPFVTEQI